MTETLAPCCGVCGTSAGRFLVVIVRPEDPLTIGGICEACGRRALRKMRRNPAARAGVAYLVSSTTTGRAVALELAERLGLPMRDVRPLGEEA